MNIARGISIVLLLFAYNANAKEETHNICNLTHGHHNIEVSLERCPELKRGDLLAGLSQFEAPFYCDTRFPIVYEGSRIYCRYNGAKLLKGKFIEDREKGKRI